MVKRLRFKLVTKPEISLLAVKTLRDCPYVPVEWLAQGGGSSHFDAIL